MVSLGVVQPEGLTEEAVVVVMVVVVVESHQHSAHMPVNPETPTCH